MELIQKYDFREGAFEQRINDLDPFMSIYLKHIFQREQAFLQEKKKQKIAKNCAEHSNSVTFIWQTNFHTQHPLIEQCIMELFHSHRKFSLGMCTKYTDFSKIDATKIEKKPMRKQARGAQMSYDFPFPFEFPINLILNLSNYKNHIFFKRLLITPK